MAHAECGAGGCAGGARLLPQKKRGQSHRPEGKRIAARLGGWWRLGLNWRRVVAVCLRAGWPARCSRLAAVGRLPSIATQSDASGLWAVQDNS